MPIPDPGLSRLGAFDQFGRAHALALVGILAGHDVAHQGAVRVVDHQRVARQRRAAKAAQRRQPLLAGRQVVAVEHPQLPARQARRPAKTCGHRRQPLCAALHQRAQHRRLGALDLGVQRRQRHRHQLVHLARRRMQRWAQAQCDQRHQFHHGGEQQLARVLALAVLLEHLVDPLRRQRLVQRQARHHARRAGVLEPLNNRLPDFLLLFSSQAGAYG